MLRIRPARWAVVLLTAFAFLIPAFDGSGNTSESAVVADASPGDMIWG
ncbi:hypothetical protein ACFY0P_10695 [Streptomyces sp. NPDC001714]